MPKKPPKKSGAAELRERNLAQLQVPLPRADRDLVRAAAALSGQSAAMFCAAVLVAAARKVVSEHDFGES